MRLEGLGTLKNAMITSGMNPRPAGLQHSASANDTQECMAQNFLANELFRCTKKWLRRIDLNHHNKFSIYVVANNCNTPANKYSNSTAKISQ
jgi:hypothetical protein